jgi:MFS family permease
MSFASCWSDVYLAAGARAVSSCGDFLAATALALAFQQTGAGGTAVSGLLLAASLPPALLAPVAGRIADRVDSRTVLVVAGIAQAAVCTTLAFAGSPALIIGLVAVLAAGLAITGPTLFALLPDMVGPRDLPRASGVNQTAGLLGVLVAPALAGILVGQFGVRVPLLLDAASYLALVAAGLLIRTRRRGRPAGPADRPAWRLRDDRLVGTMVIAVAAVVAGVGAINVIEVFFVRETLHASATVFGFVSASWTVGMVAGSLLFGRLLTGVQEPGRLVRLSLLLMGLVCAMVVAGAGVWTVLILVPLWVVAGWGNGGLNVCTSVVITHRVPAEARGRAFAAMGSAVQGAAMIGVLIGGPLVDRFQPRVLVFGAGLAGLIAVLACRPAVRRAMRCEPPGSTVVRPRVLAGDSVGG